MSDLSSHLEGFAWQGSTLLVRDDEKIARIRRKNLSASVAQNVMKCSASMAADSVLPWVSDPFAPNELGTAAHEVLEHLYELPAELRVRDFVIAQTMRQAEEQWSVTKLADSFEETLKLNNELRLDWTQRVTSMALGDFELEDPTKVKVYKAELEIKGILLGPTKVPFRGYIDRLDEIGYDEHGTIFEVNDYKGLDLDTPLPTPTGWTTMRDVQVGDWILGNGKPVQVTVKSEIHNRHCYTLTMDDGSALVADNVHLWTVWILDEGISRTLSTEELYFLFTEMSAAGREYQLVIMNTAPIELPEDVHRVDPKAYFSTFDRNARLPHGYLRGSIAQRKEILNLIAGFCQFGDTDFPILRGLSEGLAADILELVRSLGGDGDATTIEGEDGICVSFPNDFDDVTSAPRSRRFLSITPSAPVPTQCIQVDSEDSLYLAGSTFVLTHNTGKYKPHNPRFSDGYGDQMRLYAAAVEVELGRRPAGANLLYTAAGKKRVIDLSEGAIRMTLNEFDQAWQIMNRDSDAKSFPTTPNNLCGWCNLCNSCPVAMLKTPKARAHAATLPSKVDLGIPVIPVAAPIDPRVRQPAVVPVIHSPQVPVATPAAGAQATPELALIDTPSGFVLVTLPPVHLLDSSRIGASVTTSTLEQENSMTLQYPTSEYAAMAAFSLTDTAVDHLVARGQVFSPESMTAFTQVLAEILTTTERALFGTVAWEHGKHARLGFALASTIKLRPAPFGGTAEEWEQWRVTIGQILSAKASIAIGLLSSDSYSPSAYAPFVGGGLAAAAPAPTIPVNA